MAHRPGYSFSSSDDDDENQTYHQDAPTNQKQHELAVQIQSGKPQSTAKKAYVNVGMDRQPNIYDDDHKFQTPLPPVYRDHGNRNYTQQQNKPRYPPATQGKTNTKTQNSPTAHSQEFRSDQKIENEKNDFPVIPLFHAKFKEKPFNAWDTNNQNDKRMYSVVNKPGGLGIGGDKPQIANNVYQSNRGYNGPNRGRANYRGRGRGRGGNFNGKKCILCGGTGHIAKECRRRNNAQQHQIQY